MINIHEDILCPITKSIFYEPVCASDGHIYEKNAILKWFKTHNTSPITNNIINKKLYNCYTIKSIIDKYLNNYPKYLVDQYDYNKRLFLNNYKNVDYLEKIEKINITMLSPIEWRDIFINTDIEYFLKILDIVSNIEDDIEDNYKLLDVIMFTDKMCNYITHNDIPLQIYKYLINKYTNVNLLHNFNRTIMWYVCSDTDINLEILQFFINKGCMMHIKDEDNIAPIHNLCLNDNLSFDILKYIINIGVNINLTGENEYLIPLSYLSLNNNVSEKMMNYFIDNIDITHNLCIEFFKDIIYNMHPRCVDYLLKKIKNNSNIIY